MMKKKNEGDEEDDGIIKVSRSYSVLLCCRLIVLLQRRPLGKEGEEGTRRVINSIVVAGCRSLRRD